MDYPEGATPLDPDELEGLRFKHVTRRDELDHLEQGNIASGLAWLERKKKLDVLTDDFARNLHKRLFGEVWKWAGTYRKTEKNIGIDPRHISVQLRALRRCTLLAGPRYLFSARGGDPAPSPYGLHSSVPKRKWTPCPHHGGCIAHANVWSRSYRLGGWLWPAKNE